MIEQALEAWLRAEWLFRCGPNAYDQQTADWYEQATENLRQAAFGVGDLHKAYRSLAGDKPKQIRRKP